MYFPAIFDDTTSKEYYDLLKERTRAMLDCIIKGDTKERGEKVERLTDRIILYTKPLNFTGAASEEITYDKLFEDMCLVISQNLHTDPKKMTVMEYYNTYQFIDKQTKAKKRQNKAR